MSMKHVLLALPVATGLCVGCSGSSEPAPGTTTSAAAQSVDIDSIEERIVAELTNPDFEGDPSALDDLAVTCPRNVQAKSGTSFKCDLTAKSSSAAPKPGIPMRGWAGVTLNDDAGQAFLFRYDIDGNGFSKEGEYTVS